MHRGVSGPQRLVAVDILTARPIGHDKTISRRIGAAAAVAARAEWAVRQVMRINISAFRPGSSFRPSKSWHQDRGPAPTGSTKSSMMATGRSSAGMAPRYGSIAVVQRLDRTPACDCGRRKADHSQELHDRRRGVLGPDGLSRFEELNRREAADTAISMPSTSSSMTARICAIVHCWTARRCWHDCCTMLIPCSSKQSFSRRANQVQM
jgi:hypothetical protein